ncbi:MAG: NUDIX hydrolase [Candidatus Micrarchaeales archaeon]
MSKIPKSAKRVYKGEIFDVYQWKQKMFDGTYETFERIRRPNTVQVIATEGNKILITRERQPAKTGTSLGFLGGMVDSAESPLHAAKRELLEESGRISKRWKLIGKLNPHSKIDWTVFLFLAGDCKKVAEQELDPGEKIKIVKLGFDKFMKIAPKIDRYNLANFTMLSYDRKKRAKFRKLALGSNA